MSEKLPISQGLGLDESGDSSAHRQEFDEADLYHYAAGMYLTQAIDKVLSEGVSQLKAEEGVWHPSGFMVFRLGAHQALGALRLHVWPEGFRKRELRGRGQLETGIWDGDIHDHAWFVDGLNIAGYRDKLFSPQRVDTDMAVYGVKRDFTAAEIAEHGLLRIFRATYVSEKHFDILTTGNEYWDYSHSSDDVTTYYAAYQAQELEERILASGEIHSINPGVYHAPSIPEDTFGATLAFNSHRMPHAVGPNILIGGEQSRYSRVREPVTFEEWELAKESLAKCTL